MGQSVLRDRKTPFRSGANAISKKDDARILSKGNRVNIPEPGIGVWLFSGHVR